MTHAKNQAAKQKCLISHQKIKRCEIFFYFIISQAVSAKVKLNKPFLNGNFIKKIFKIIFKFLIDQLNSKNVKFTLKVFFKNKFVIKFFLKVHSKNKFDIVHVL